MKKSWFRKLSAALLALITVYCFSLYFVDQREVSRFLSEINGKTGGKISYAHLNFAEMTTLRDAVVSELEIKTEKLGKRKAWGFRVSRIIAKRSGQCGEVTRLLINLFHKLDIPARRVTLFGKDFMHAVIEANSDGHWVILDTANSPEGFKDIVSGHPSAISDHFQKPPGAKTYLFNVSAEFKKVNIAYFSYFFNLNSIAFRFLGLHIFVGKPLPVWLYFLMENPPLLVAWMTLTVLLVILASLVLQKLKHKHDVANPR